MHLDKPHTNRFRKLMPTSTRPEHPQLALLATGPRPSYARTRNVSRQHSLEPPPREPSPLGNPLRTISHIEESRLERAGQQLSEFRLKRHRQLVAADESKQDFQKYRRMQELISQFELRCTAIASMTPQEYQRQGLLDRG
jgi:hypothetical protein